jgi:hypothetical protein
MSRLLLACAASLTLALNPSAVLAQSAPADSTAPAVAPTTSPTTTPTPSPSPKPAQPLPPVVVNPPAPATQRPAVSGRTAAPRRSPVSTAPASARTTGQGGAFSGLPNTSLTVPTIEQARREILWGERRGRLHPSTRM